MKNVNFGCLFTVKETPVISKKQRKIEDTVNDVFEKRNKKYGLNDGNYRNLDDMLEEDMLMDVAVIHKKNGNVELKLTDTDNSYARAAKGIVKTKDKIKVVLDKNLSLSEIKSKLKKYTDKCFELAKFYDVEIPNAMAAKKPNMDDFDIDM